MNTGIAILIAGAVAALAGLAGGIFSNRSNERSVRDTNNTNLLVQQETNSANANLWREQTEYNKPENQVQRLLSAGLNPAMMSGNLSNLGSAEAAPEMGAAQMMANRYNNPVSSIENVALQAAQADALRAEANKANADAARTQGLLPYEMEAMNALTELNKSATDVNTQQVFKVMAETGYTKEQAEVARQTAEQIRLSNEEFSKGMQDRLDMLSAKKEMTSIEMQYFEKDIKQRIDTAKAQAEHLRATAQQALSNAHLNDEQKKLIEKQVSNYDNVINNLNAQTKQLNANADLTNFEKTLREKYGEDQVQSRLKTERYERTTMVIGNVCKVLGVFNDGMRNGVEAVKAVGSIIP